MINIETICNYIKQNFGDYTKTKKYYYKNNDVECVEFKTKTIYFTFCFDLHECYMEFWNKPTYNKMANDFATWYIANIAKSAKHKITNGIFKNDNVKWLQINYTPNDDTQITLNKIINALNAQNEYTLTNGYINLYGKKSMCKTLIHKKHGFKILFDDLYHIKIWNLDNATSFQNAHDLAKPIINTIMQTANFKSYDYDFVNCMFSYNMGISFK